MEPLKIGDEFWSGKIVATRKEEGRLVEVLVRRVSPPNVDHYQEVTLEWVPVGGNDLAA